jgi:hypothetical protein
LSYNRITARTTANRGEDFCRQRERCKRAGIGCLLHDVNHRSSIEAAARSACNDSSAYSTDSANVEYVCDSFSVVPGVQSSVTAIDTVSNLAWVILDCRT